MKISILILAAMVLVTSSFASNVKRKPADDGGCGAALVTATKSINDGSDKMQAAADAVIQDCNIGTPAMTYYQELAKKCDVYNAPGGSVPAHANAAQKSVCLMYAHQFASWSTPQ